MASSTSSVVQLREIYKFHRTRTVQTAALNGINLSVRAGEFVAITGPSGSGKSTLLNVVGLIDEASKGEYLFRGQPVHRLSRRQRSALRKDNMGFIFQSFTLLMS